MLRGVANFGSLGPLLRGALTVARTPALPLEAYASVNAEVVSVYGPSCWLGKLRSLTTSSPASYPDVVVPAMGDSISEGTIAAVLKHAGDPVAMDETIAQIETDKVTIDIKSTVSGVLQRIGIKVSDVVKPGQVIAFVGEAAGAQAASPASTSSTASAAGGDAPGQYAFRRVGIQFPPRRTETGDCISNMPEALAKEYLAKRATAAAPAPVTTTSSSSATSEAPPVAPQPYRPPVPVTAAPPPPKRVQDFAAPRDFPNKRPISARELEIINLGGAMP